MWTVPNTSTELVLGTVHIGTSTWNLTQRHLFQPVSPSPGQNQIELSSFN